MAIWQMQAAKSKLSELILRADTEGPQVISRYGLDRAVVLSMKDYQVLLAHKPDFKSHLLGGPKFDHFLIRRERNACRPVKH